MAHSRILVIDDDPLFRSLLTSMLCQEFSVSTASDGAEGYYKALEQPPDLTIVDIKMPGWDGLRTLKAFRAHHLLATRPIMMLTGDASRPSIQAALEAGANDYVIKTTLSREILIRKVHRQLGEPDVDSDVDSIDRPMRNSQAALDGLVEDLPAFGVAPPPEMPVERLTPCRSADQRSYSANDGALRTLIVDWE